MVLFYGSCVPLCSFFFFFNDTATTEIYPLSLHDALPICGEAAPWWECSQRAGRSRREMGPSPQRLFSGQVRSEEHTSELQSRSDLVCRLLLEKKKQQPMTE